MMRDERSLQIGEDAAIKEKIILLFTEIEKRPMLPSEILRWAAQNKLSRSWTILDNHIRELIDQGVLTISDLRIAIKDTNWRNVLC